MMRQIAITVVSFIGICFLHAPACEAQTNVQADAAIAKQTSISSEFAPVLVTAAEWQKMAEANSQHTLFAGEKARVTAAVRIAMAAGINVPTPKDPGGGASHEQHKRNYQAILGAGTLYRITGDRTYANFVRDMLLEYARLYPTLGNHPAGRGQIPGRLFWQTLNDSVWLVYSIRGYDAIRDTLSDADRRTIDEQVFRRMADFLSGNPENFDRIHNHGTWAAAAVGMTGYVLRDRNYVEKALLGSKLDSKSGFLTQIDQLFSPDGYYGEGPYYQRYALAPFIIFANVIERNEPQRKIFARRDGVLLKAVSTLVHTSYSGYFFPINDAITDKGVDTEELVAGIAIAYAKTGDASLLSIAQRQGRTLLSPEGLGIAEALAANKAKPFVFRPLQLRDGNQGNHGSLDILRMGDERGQTLVMKNTAQGMGHGHFDKLHWLFYDNGHAVVTDYGAARFLNIEAKSGGIYLPENTSWAKQTISHNTLVVDERSHFDGDWKEGEKHAPTSLLFDVSKDTQIASAKIQNAYPGVVFDRTLALISHPDLGLPVVIDLLRAHSDKAHRYDLPLHFDGHLMTVGFDAQRSLAERPVLGKDNGYQHLWVDAIGAASTQPRTLSWLQGKRFYTYRFGTSAPSQAILAESGANDPNFNLRREQSLIQRMDGQTDATFFSVLEPHGEYNGTAEYVYGAHSRIRSIELLQGKDADVIILSLVTNKTLALGVADDPSSKRQHSVDKFTWAGGYARFDDSKTAKP